MLTNVTRIQFYYRQCLWLLSLMLMPLVSEASLQVAIDDLLDKADQDLAADRLMTPVSNNALDRYRAVLLLDKSNQRAALGLRAIANRYMEMSRLNIKRGQFSRARKMLANAVSVNGNTPATQKVAKEIRSAQARRVVKRVAPKPSPVIPPVNEKQTIFALNTADLSQRNQAMVDQLWSLGRRVQDTKEYVLIYARNDSEGRWIYQQMRKASTSYRLRGNIKRNKKPRVILEAPLN
ncbi:MAG: hypothetical protein ACRBCI_15480 [Cellvibrionaceae bacterium]